jgi:hypothetical protein
MTSQLINRSLVFRRANQPEVAEKKTIFSSLLKNPKWLFFFGRILALLMVTSQCPDSANFLTAAKIENLNYSEGFQFRHTCSHN